MKQGIALLEQFNDDDAEWILATATERDLPQGEALIEAGQPLDALFLVVQGVLGVFADESGTQLATLGPGDLVGEMSFLDATLPTETVRALEHSLVLSLPHSELTARTGQVPEFSTRLHRALARLLSDRLRTANRRLRVSAETDVTGHLDAAPWQRLNQPLQVFKAALLEANESAKESGGVIPESVSTGIVEQFLAFCPLIGEVLSEDVDNDRVREEMGLRLQQELLPYILLAETAERFYSKPRGYAGDFWTIELMYRNEPKGTGALGQLIDRCFLDVHAVRAVRNRRPLLSEEIDKAIRSSERPTTQITTLACGPARELFDVFSTLPEASQLHANLLDIDLQALAFVADEAKAHGIHRQMTLQAENLIRLAVGKTRTDIKDQDLIYSIGLIDYFGDDLVIRLLNLVHSMLRPGGRVILGNVHPCNPTRGLQDHVLDWRLVHRTEDDMNRLYESSSFGRPCTNIRFEPEGLNLFAECVR